MVGLTKHEYTNMKYLIHGLFLTAMLSLVSACGEAKDATTPTETSEAGATGTYMVDVANSRVKWKGVMLGIKFHEGILKFSEGELTLENGVITGGSFTVDMASMTATDENYQPEQGATREKLLRHLASPDFFDVANYPTATFVIRASEGVAATGALTVRGVTHTETVQNIALIEADGVVKANGNLVFDRKKYNVSWDSPMQDVILSNNIELSIDIAASSR